MKAAVSSVDQTLPPRQMFVLGLQHLAVSYIGIITVPLIIASALKLSQDDAVILIGATIFFSGIATLLQSVGFWKFGVNLPILQGVAFSSVGPVIAIGTNPSMGLAGVCGAVIIAGLFTMLAAPFVGRLRRFFPPVVTGCIVTVIGVQLFPVAYAWMGGGYGAANFGALPFLLVALTVLATILAVNRFGGPLLRNLAVLTGIAVGTLLGFALDMSNFSSVADAPWFTLPKPFYFGMPTFAFVPILTMIVVMTVQMVESMGLFLAIGDIVEKPIHDKEAINGLRANGLASAIAGMFAAFPFIAFMENIGLTILTGVRSRWVVATCGGLLCLLALTPKVSAIFAATPVAVLGGAGIAMFGVVAAAGIQALARVDYQHNRYNTLIVGITIPAGLIPVFSPTLFQALPEWSQPFLHSGVVIACVVAVVLNFLLNGVSAKTESVEQCAVGNA